MTKVAIMGATGRMGQALIRCSQLFSDIEIAAAIDQKGLPDIGKDAGRVSGIQELGVMISDDCRTAANADIIIDFTFHTVAPTNAALAVELDKALLLGTTGLDENEAQAIHKAAEKVPVLWAPNMSLGVNLLFNLVEQAARTLGLDYDIEIIETHHKHKKDAPSGTALRLGEKAAGGRNQNFSSVVQHGRQGVTGERTREEIGMHAVRAGDIVGDHTVIFASEGERIELSHRATSRDTFALGALRAARWLSSRQPGLYDMQDVLGI